jgi:DNA (cytosine-5)-methyltransferase 1
MLRTAVDLFAGLGGNSLGAQLAGLRVVVAANHWSAAVEAHHKNHPDTEHLCQDLQQADFTKWPDHDVMLSSPCCQGYSHSRGRDRPHHDASRSTAWAVVSCTEAKRPKAVVVENVPEFAKWQLYPLWRRCLEELGYRLSEQVLNAADLGVPQDRRRLFVVGVRRDMSREAITIPPGNHPHVPASTILSAEGRWSPILKPGRALRTLRQILNGRRKLGGRFLIPYFGSGSGLQGRSLDRPIGTLRTRDSYALVDGPLMRMLTAPEYLRGQGFPASYRLTGDHKTDVMLIGNATSPPVMQSVLGHLNKQLSVDMAI